MAFADAVSQVMTAVDEVRGWQEDLYRDLHQHPELSHLEHRTAAAVADRLGRAGFEVYTGVGGTGVVGILRNGDGPTVLLRADMDALPVKEDTGLPYASTAVAIPAAGGDPMPVAHACGHDMHTTCLLGAAQLLADGEKHWCGKLVVVFQPAEETVDGARGNPEHKILLGPSIQFRPLGNVHLDVVALAGLTEDAPDLETWVVFGWDFGGGPGGRTARSPVSGRR